MHSINVGNQYKQVVEIFGRQENYSFDENDFIFLVYDCDLSTHVLLFDKDKMRLRINAFVSTSADFNPLVLNSKNIYLFDPELSSVSIEPQSTLNSGFGSARYLETQCIITGDRSYDLYKNFVIFHSDFGIVLVEKTTKIQEEINFTMEF